MRRVTNPSNLHPKKDWMAGRKIRFFSTWNVMFGICDDGSEKKTYYIFLVQHIYLMCCFFFYFQTIKIFLDFDNNGSPPL